MTPGVVLFDLGDVVAAWDPAPRLAAYAGRAGLAPAEVRERLARDGFWSDTDRGRYTADEMADGIRARLGCAFSRAELLRLQAAAFTVRPELVRLARAAAERARVGMLTNNAPLLREAFPVHFPALEHAFDPLLFSFELGAVKPEPALFERATARLGVAPERIVFVDDQPAHVAAARALGWDAILYESAPRLAEALRERGVLA